MYNRRNLLKCVKKAKSLNITLMSRNAFIFTCVDSYRALITILFLAKLIEILIIVLANLLIL